MIPDLMIISKYFLYILKISQNFIKNFLNLILIVIFSKFIKFYKKNFIFFVTLMKNFKHILLLVSYFKFLHKITLYLFN